MKKLIALLLVCAILVGCTPRNSLSESAPPVGSEGNQTVFTPEAMPEFSSLGDTALLAYLEDAVYTELVTELNSAMYFVENVSAVYISKEYLEEIAYNSQENIYFGYTLSELDACFVDTRYVFTLGEDGKTIVTAFESYDDTYNQMLRNVTIGTGVILLCVTVSAVSAGAGAPAVSLIFAASAKSGAIMGLSSGLFSGVAAGVVTGIETNDFDAAMKAAALAGSESFKWSAITGAISGGVSESIKYGKAMQALKGVQLNGLTTQQAAAIQMESGYPVDVIKQFTSMEQYNICKTAGLLPQMVNGNTALIRNIDLDFVDDMGRTNLQRMQQGLAALDPDGVAYELHHIGQHADSTLAILTKAEHMQGGNNKIWHILGESSEVHGAGNTWDTQRQQFWMAIAKMVANGGA